MSGFTTLMLDLFEREELNRFLGLQGAFIGLGGMVIFFVFPVQIPFYLAENRVLNGSLVGLALSLQTLISVFSALPFQTLKARCSFTTILAILFSAFAANHLILGFSGSYLVIVAALLLGGFGVGLFPPNSNGWLATVTPLSVRGKAVGGLTSVTFLGQFFSPLLTQPLISSFGLANTFLIAAVVSIGTALFFLTAARLAQRPMAAAS
ncbi:MAG: MFS transporter [Chloroflexota bacterium]